MRDIRRGGTIERLENTIHQRQRSFAKRRGVHQLRVYTQAILNPLGLRRIYVADTSMQPALRPGDRLLVWRSRRIKSGDIVVFRDPEAPGTLLIKRVVSITSDDRLDVRGDNPNVSRDSRHFGTVPKALVLGRAAYRYLPAARRGRL
jgi:nickel-type superoxide dismutase maturation protease